MKRGTLNIEALFAVFAATTRARYITSVSKAL